MEKVGSGIRDKHPGSATLNLLAKRTAWWEAGEEECLVGHAVAGEFKYLLLTQKTVSKLSEIRSGMFIPDPDPGSRS